MKHHVIHVEENATGTSGKFHGFVSSKITADIVEKLVRLQNNRKALNAVKKLVDSFANNKKRNARGHKKGGGSDAK